MRNNARNESLAKLWQRRIKAGQAKKADYDAAAKEVMQYFRAKHDDFFKEMAAKFCKFNDGGVSVNKSAQIRGILGPHLYQKNPKVEVGARAMDQILVALAKVLKTYLNYTPNETGLARNVRKAIDDSLLRGRGFLRTGWDDRYQLVTSWYVSSMDVVIDPDFDSLEDAKWVAVRRRVPFYELKRDVGKKDRWRLTGLHDKVRGDSPADGEDDEDYEEDEEASSPTNDVVEYWEVWSKAGIGWRFHDADESFKTHNDDADFVKVSVCLYHDTLLEEGDWEVPLYLDNEWPLVELDLVEALDELWPTSLFSQSLSHQKVIDLVSSLELAKLKEHSREIYFVDDTLEVQDMERLRTGGTSEMIRVKAKGNHGKKLPELMHRFQPGMISPELGNARNWHEREMNMITGMTSILHGESAAVAQERSATAAQLKKEASNTRLGDFTSKVEQWISRARRNEALCIRLLDGGPMESDDVEKVYRRGMAMEETEQAERMSRYGNPQVPQAVDGAVALGFLVSLDPGTGELPVKDRRDENERLRDAQLGADPLSLELIAPQAATYFSTPEEATQAAQAVVEAMKTHHLPEVQEAFRRMVVIQPDPVTGVNSMQIRGVEVREVRVEDVWRDTSGMEPRDMVREFNYTISTGSTRRVDPERKLELAETMVQQVLPLAVQNGDYVLVNAILGQYFDALEVPVEERLPPLQPPPPPPAPAPGGVA